MSNKLEIRNSKFEGRIPIEFTGANSRASRARHFEFRISNFEFLRQFRLPLRSAPDIEQTAARNRAERLFAVNFRSTWTR